MEESRWSSPIGTLTASDDTLIESLPSNVDEFPRFTTACYDPRLVQRIWSMCRKVGLHAGTYGEVLHTSGLVCTLTAYYHFRAEPVHVRWLGHVEGEVPFFSPSLFDNEEEFINHLRMFIMHEALK